MKYIGLKTAGLNFNKCFLFAAGVDYTVNMADLTITIPAGEPAQQCIPVGIVDDDIPLELPETFTFNFTSLPEGVAPGSVPESIVTIVDDDSAGESI